MTETVLHMLGHVGTDIDHRKVGAGIDLATFRLASTPRRWDRQQRGYVDGTTSWITVQCWRSLAVHVRDSVRRGDPVIVVGRLKTEEWTKDEVRNTRFVLEAQAVGHDLSRGTSSFAKAVKQSETVIDESQDAIAAIRDVEREAELLTEPTESEPVDPAREGSAAAEGQGEPAPAGDSTSSGWSRAS